MAVFRELPDLAKYYVMRTLFVEQPISRGAASAWVTSGSKGKHDSAITSLTELKIWNETTLPGNSTPAFNVSYNFRQNLRKAVVCGGDSWASTAHLGPDKHGKDIDALDKYAVERWNVLLHHLVGSSANSPVSQDIKDLVNFSGLMRVEDGNSVITTKGFQFLLLDQTSQVWYFVLEYLRWVRERGMNLVPILRFLFEISFSKVGKDLPTDDRDEHVLTCLQHFREIGLVMQRKRKSRRFYPTHLAVNLTSGASSSALAATEKGFLIAETNYRVYAYTDSDLQYAILSLFCEMLYRFPNVCVMQITRESIQTAVVNGITADQILHYITANAHPDMQKNNPILTSAFCDQLRLWAMERDRLKYREGVLYNQFLAQKDFDALRDYAKDLGALIWENPGRRYMIVKSDAHDQVKRYWKRYKKDAEG